MNTGWFAIIGTIVGAAATWFAGWSNDRRERIERQRVVTMQIAAQMRLRLIETAQTFEDYIVFYEPDPDDFDYTDADDEHQIYVFLGPSDIPPFPFNDALERISSLQCTDAQSLFNLIEQRLEAERRARVAASLNDYDDAGEIFARLIAGVFLEGLAIYKRLAKQVGWSEDVVTSKAEQDMRKRADDGANPNTAPWAT